MKSIKISSLLISVLCIGCLFAQTSLANELTPKDFAYGMPLTIEPGALLYRLTVPTKVYQYATQVGLGDVRVFDSTNTIVPSALRRIAAQQKLTNQVNLPVFPIYGKTGVDVVGMPLRVQRNQRGTIVEIGTKGAAKSQRTIVAYLLDASSIKKPLHSITLHTQQTSKSGFIQRFNVSYSDDLNHYTPIISEAAIVSLHQNNRSIEQRDIALNDTRANYWLLTGSDSTEQPVKIIKVTAEPSSEYVAPERSAIQLTAISSQPDKGEYLFKLQGHMPIDGARVIFPEKNQVAQAKLFSRADPNDKWSYQNGGLVYDLQAEGKQSISTELQFAQATDQYWRLVIEGNQSKNATAPILELRWTPEELMFVANGKPLYLLAYGNGKIDAANFNVNEFIDKITATDGTAPVIKTAAVGDQQNLGGEYQLRSAIPWQKWLLWFVLIIGTGLLIWMAVRLFKQLGQ